METWYDYFFEDSVDIQKMLRPMRGNKYLKTVFFMSDGIDTISTDEAFIQHLNLLSEKDSR